MNEEAAKPHAELEERLRFEALITDLSLKFINLAPGDVDREITEAQRRFCEVLDLDTSAIWQWSGETAGTFVLTHYYSAQGGPQPPMRLRDVDFPWVREQMSADRVIVVSSLDELPAAAARDREIAGQLGIKSSVCIPLSAGGQRPFGILGLNTVRAEREWPDALVNRLKLVAQVFANALARKRADEALRESQERLSLAADSAGAGLWALDHRTRVFWVTERARALFGFSPEAVVSMDRFKESVHPDDWSRVQGVIQRSLQTGEALHVEYRIRLGDGGTRWIVSAGGPIRRPRASRRA